jgi:hypothetical protein
MFYFRSRPATLLAGVGGTSMSVKMTNSEVHGVSVVELDGRIVLAEESNSLREKLKKFDTISAK